MNLWISLMGDQQIQAAGHAAIWHDDGTKVGTFHDAVIVTKTEAARRIAFSRLVVT
jgi:hypothetical protein